MKPSTPLSILPADVENTSGGEWLALHVYYTANAHPLLGECVAPLIRQLRERGLIDRWFFIRYWLEGPHIRLRFRPSSDETVAAAKAEVERHVDEFLARRPAVYELDLDLAGDVYKEMFLNEYSEEQWAERYGDDTEMPVQPNNSRMYVEYVPEYDRYGGPAGIELAERHFETSSDMVLRLVETTNIHVRSVLFGLATQLILVMGFVFLPEPERLAEFFDGYRDYWETSFTSPGEVRHDLYDEAYAELAPALHARLRDMHDKLAAGRDDELTGFVAEWAAHCRELRAEALQLVADGRLVFQSWEDAAVHRIADNPALVLRVLLSSYVHMTDNRLGVTIHDEIYLSYVLHRALQDCLLAAPAG